MEYLREPREVEVVDAQMRRSEEEDVRDRIDQQADADDLITPPKPGRLQIEDDRAPCPQERVAALLRIMGHAVHHSDASSS